MPKIKMPARSYYDRTHDVKGDINMGRMYPVLHEEVNPGDTFEDVCEVMIRMNPMIRPILTEMTAYIRVFFVRDWTIFDDFDEMISLGPDGDSDVVLPMNGANYTVAEGSNEDWLNINPGVYDADSFNTMAKRAFNKCYNDWYRPQNQVPDEIDLESQADLYTTWERDFFTNSLPFTQRGPQVVMPLGTLSGPLPVRFADNDSYVILGRGISGESYGTSSNPNKKSIYSIAVSGRESLESTSPVQPFARIDVTPVYSGTVSASYPDNLKYTSISGNGTFSASSLYADPVALNSITMNDWRNYMQVQSWMELNALGGVRYPELVLQHFGVVTPDARVQRAEYLGSMKVPIIVSEVLQTSSTDDTSPQGNLSGHGIGANKRRLFKRSFTEHGWLIGILTWLPKGGYQQGIPLEYQRESALDFAWPLFTRLGMRDMPIKTIYTGAYLKDGEVVAPDTTGAVWTPVADPNATFSYYTIYDELRYKSSSVHGRFRSNMAFWHLNRIFKTAPALSQQFVECHPDTERIKAVTTESDGVVQIIHRLHAYRELPKNPTPWHF